MWTLNAHAQEFKPRPGSSFLAGGPTPPPPVIVVDLGFTVKAEEEAAVAAAAAAAAKVEAEEDAAAAAARVKAEEEAAAAAARNAQEFKPRPGSSFLAGGPTPPPPVIVVDLGFTVKAEEEAAVAAAAAAAAKVEAEEDAAAAAARVKAEEEAAAAAAKVKAESEEEAAAAKVKAEAEASAAAAAAAKVKAKEQAAAAAAAAAAAVEQRDRLGSNRFEVLRLHPESQAPVPPPPTTVQHDDGVRAGQVAEEGAGHKGSSRPGLSRKKKQGSDAQRRRSDQHRGHPDPDKKMHQMGGGGGGQSSSDPSDYERLTEPIYRFHQNNGQCRKPDPWGDGSTRGFRGGRPFDAIDAVARALGDRQQNAQERFHDPTQAAESLASERKAVLQRPVLFRLWEKYWDAEVALHHVTRAHLFAREKVEKAVEQEQQERANAREEGPLHASTSSAIINRADEGDAEKSPAAAAAPVTLFVRNDAGRTRTVHIELRASVAELEEAVRRKVPGTEEMRLCAVGGAPLVAARGLTLAEYGIGANSSLQMLGRLPGGGGELVLGGETYAVGDSGHLDLAGRGLGPAELAELARWLATEASAAVEAVALSQNTLGGRTVALAPIASTIDTPEVGCVVLEDSQFYEIISIEGEVMRWKSLETRDVLEDEIQLEELESDEISVYRTEDIIVAYPFGDLCKALKASRVTSLNLSECGLSSVELAELAEYVRDATAAVEAVVLKGNMITGSKQDESTDWKWQYDNDLSGITALCEALPSLKKPISLDLSDCGLSVKGVTEIAKATSAGAEIARVDLRSNELNDDALAQLRGLADFTVGQVFVWVREGKIDLSSAGLTTDDSTSLSTFLATPAGAAITSLKVGGADFGNVWTVGANKYQLKCGNYAGLSWRKSPDVDDRSDEVAAELSLHTAIDQTDEWIQVAEGKWLPKKFLVEMDKPCVFQTFCDALKMSQVTEIDFSSCGLGSPAMEILSDYVRDATAAVEIIDLSGCGLTGATKDGYWQEIDSNMDGFIALCAVLGKVRTVRLADCGLGASSVAELSKIFSDATAALNAIVLDGQALSGSMLDYSYSPPLVNKIDADLSGFKLLCEALASSKIEDVSMQSCYLGPQALTLLTEAISSMAGVARIDVSSESTKYSSIPLCAQFPLQNLSGAAKRFLTSIPRVSTAQRTRASVPMAPTHSRNRFTGRKFNHCT
eukprot:COSAG06_NODE_1834_length_8257_cov_188.231920_3_plen_1195_part_00